MATATDFLISDESDLAITPAGDLALGESDSQHVGLLLLTNQGEWRQDPLVGIGLRRHQSAPMGAVETAALQREIDIQLTRDGYQVLEMDLSDLSAAVINAERP